MGSTLDDSITLWVAKGWQLERRTDTEAVLTSTAKPNHVMYGLVMAGLVFIGGPAAFCVGGVGEAGNRSEGIEPTPGMLVMTLGVWLVVVAIVGFVWARAAKSTVVRKTLTQHEDGHVTYA